MSSSGERKRWVRRWDATCRPSGRAGEGYEANGSWKEVFTSLADSGSSTKRQVCSVGCIVEESSECTVVTS
jgi:hypothetical protein